jgi:hypothetical protein
MDLDQGLLPIIETELCTKPWTCHRGTVKLLKRRHHGVDTHLEGAVLTRVNKARAQDGAERPIPKEQAASL